VIEEGTYRARSRRAALGESSTGKEQVAVEWELIEGPSNCAGQTITSYHYFSSDEAIRISMEQLRTGGFTGNDITDLRSLFPDSDPPEVELVIAHEIYAGKTRPKVKFVNSIGGMAMSKPLDDAKARAFAARMKGAIAAFDHSRGEVRPISTRPPQVAQQQRVRDAVEKHAGFQPPPADPNEFHATDDDVPF
jgi:hypothetical protein